MASLPVPLLLDRRSTGLIRPNTFSHRILACHPNWSLSSESHRIISTTNQGNCITTTLDLSSTSEYLLTGNAFGTCCIYHIGEPKVTRHTPLQQALCPGGGQIAAVQWYPVDTGVFVTATTAGGVCIWDTNAMTPVLHATPFAFRTTEETAHLRCMHVAPFQALAAVGAKNCSSIQLVELQTGASSHSLTPRNANQGGIHCIQWSPVNSHLLASCGPESITLWDIRRPNRVLAQCNEMDQPQNPLVAECYAWDGSHFRTPSCNGGGSGATRVAFDSTGQKLVTIDGQHRNVSVWDLRHTRPLRQQGHYVDEDNGKPVDRNKKNQPLVVMDDSFYCVKGNNLVQYPLANDNNGQATMRLTGHLGRIQAITATQSMLITAADDALVLVWERHHRQKRVARRGEQEDKDNW